MRAQRTVVVLSILAVVLLASAARPEAGQEGAEPQMSPEMQAEMDAWMKLAQPGDHHQHLAPFVGTWKGEVTMWMDPDAEPMVEESLAEASWIMGGRYLEWKHAGSFAGMPFEGRAIEGFNNGDTRYESIWMDNFGTIMLFFTGSCTENGAHRQMGTQFNDVVAGGTVLYTTEYAWSDDDHFTYTAFMDKGDGKFKNLEIKYTRQ